MKEPHREPASGEATIVPGRAATVEALRAWILVLALLAGCGDRVIFAPLEEGRPLGLLVLDRDPSLGVRVFEPLPRRVEVEADQSIDLFAYAEGRLATLGLESLDGRLIIDRDGAPIPRPDHWLRGAAGDETLTPGPDLDMLDSTFPKLRVPGHCPGLTHVSDQPIPDTTDVSALVRSDATTLLIGTVTSTGVSRVYVSDVTAAAKVADLAFSSTTAGAAVGFEQDNQNVWVGYVDRGDLTLYKLTPRGRVRTETHIPWPHDTISRLAAAVVDGELTVVWSTRTRFGRLDLATNTAIELGRSTLADCAGEHAGTLALHADGTGVVGFTNGDLWSFDLASGETRALLPAEPRPCRAVYARDPLSGREVVISDGPFDISTLFWWRSEPGESWRSAQLPSLTARAAVFGRDGTLIVGANQSVVVSLAFGTRDDQPPRICDIEPYGANVTQLLAMGDYVVIAGSPDRNGVMTLVWARVGD